MLSKAERFFKDIRGKRVAMMGIGVSHTELAKRLSESGAIVTACDKRDREKLKDVALELEASGVTLKLGEGYFDNIDAEILFRTPGMNYNLPEIREFKRRGGIVTSEMEVFFDVCPCPVIAVTGSDGKTTTSTLSAAILKEQGKTVHLGGNIGKALLPCVLQINDTDIAVVELSSFQLISMRPSPQVSVVTNVAPNHLDWHRDMQEYINAKKNIFAHQNAFSTTVLGLDNEITKSFKPEIRGRALMFSLEKKVENGAYLSAENELCFACNGENLPIMHAKDIRLPGMHNVANYLAAISAVHGLGFSDYDAIRKVANNFGGVEHRIELVRELNGVKWYNDSIATSPTRAIAGLKSFDKKIIMIAGGYDKNIPYEPLAPEVINAVKLLILTGATADKIEAAVTSHPDYSQGSPEIIRAKDIPDAVQIASKAAVLGDIVSLSPASASFDAYPNFEARGRHFKELVLSLAT